MSPLSTSIWFCWRSFPIKYIKQTYRFTVQLTPLRISAEKNRSSRRWNKSVFQFQSCTRVAEVSSSNQNYWNKVFSEMAFKLSPIGVIATIQFCLFVVTFAGILSISINCKQKLDFIESNLVRNKHQQQSYLTLDLILNIYIYFVSFRAGEL